MKFSPDRSYFHTTKWVVFGILGTLHRLDSRFGTFSENMMRSYRLAERLHEINSED